MQHTVVEVEKDAAVEAKAEGLGGHGAGVGGIGKGGDGCDNKGLNKGQGTRLEGTLLVLHTTTVHGKEHRVPEKKGK